MRDPILFNADCLDAMWFIEDGSVDMILCDLPYGTTACKWDTVIPFAPLWAHYKRVIKPNGAIVLFGSEPFSSLLRVSNLKQYKYDWIWRKTLGGGAGNAKRMPMKRHEIISIFYSQQPIYNPIMFKGTHYKDNRGGVDVCRRTSDAFVSLPPRLSYDTDMRMPISVIEFSNPNNHSVHPTQKPVALCEYLIRTYTNDGETVLDNTMGSGTTGVACANTGRHFIGIERDDHYFAIAQQRIEGAL